MSLRTIMIFPEFENISRIDGMRARFDPLAGLVRPHITIVFPFESGMSDGEVEAILTKRLEGIAPFELQLSGFTAQEEPAGNWLCLNVIRGADIITNIKDMLYANEFKPFEKGFAYVPHMTVGKFEEPAQLASAYDEVKGDQTVYSTTVTKISVEMIGPNEESIIIIEKELSGGAS